MRNSMKQNRSSYNYIRETWRYCDTWSTKSRKYLRLLSVNGIPKTPFASIRRIVQLDKNIYKIKPGLYGLTKFKSLNESKGFIQEKQN